MTRLALVLLAILLAGCAARAPPPGAAPGWSFTDTDGATWTSDAPARNATVLFFMATWCGSCRAAAPMLADVQDAYAPRGAQFLSVGFDPGEPAAQLEAWKDRYRHDWPHGVDPDLRVQRAFGITSQSSVVVLDESGAVVRAWGYGQVRDAPLRAALDAALGTGAAAP